MSGNCWERWTVSNYIWAGKYVSFWQNNAMAPSHYFASPLTLGIKHFNIWYVAPDKVLIINRPSKLWLHRCAFYYLCWELQNQKQTKPKMQMWWSCRQIIIEQLWKHKDRKHTARTWPVVMNITLMWGHAMTENSSNDWVRINNKIGPWAEGGDGNEEWRGSKKGCPCVQTVIPIVFVSRCFGLDWWARYCNCCSECQPG